MAKNIKSGKKQVKVKFKSQQQGVRVAAGDVNGDNLSATNTYTGPTEVKG